MRTGPEFRARVHREEDFDGCAFATNLRMLNRVRPRLNLHCYILRLKSDTRTSAPINNAAAGGSGMTWPETEI